MINVAKEGGDVISVQNLDLDLTASFEAHMDMVNMLEWKTFGPIIGTRIQQKPRPPGDKTWSRETVCDNKLCNIISSTGCDFKGKDWRLWQTKLGKIMITLKGHK